jgi:hypothetical protein
MFDGQRVQEGRLECRPLRRATLCYGTYTGRGPNRSYQARIATCCRSTQQKTPTAAGGAAGTGRTAREVAVDALADESTDLAILQRPEPRQPKAGIRLHSAATSPTASSGPAIRSARRRVYLHTARWPEFTELDRDTIAQCAAPGAVVVGTRNILQANGVRGSEWYAQATAPRAATERGP